MADTLGEKIVTSDKTKNASEYPREFILLIALAIALASALLYGHGVFKNLELASLDLRFKLDSITPRPPSASDFILNAKAKDKEMPGIAFIDMPEPAGGADAELQYDKCASAIKILATSNAKAIVLNSLLSKPQENEKDFNLAVAVKTSDVYVPVLYGIDRLDISKIYTGIGVTGVKRPLVLFIGKNVGAGHIDAFADPDGKLRRVPAMIRYAGKDTYQLGLKIAFDMMGIKEDRITLDAEKHFISFSGTDEKHYTIPLDKDNQVMINWGDIQEKELQHFSYEDLIEAYRLVLYGVRPSLDLSVFKDKICIIGSDASKTAGPTAPQLKYNYAPAGSCGVIISNVFRNNFVRELPPLLNIAVIFLVSIVFAASLSNQRILAMMMILLTGAMFLATISVYGLPRNINLLLVFFFVALFGIALSRFQIFSGLLFTAFSALLYLVISAGLFRLFNLSIVTFYPVLSIIAIFISFYIYIKTMGYLSRMHLLNLATRDGLTALYNRRYFNLLIEAELNTARRNESRSLSILMCDIDNFKKLNDTYGHQAGDAVLKEFAATIKSQCRQSDVVARYGGEEFIIVFVGARAVEALETAERIRKAIEAKQFTFKGQAYGTTLSMGLAEFENDATKESLIEKADQALYRAKKEGKNRVCVYE